EPSEEDINKVIRATKFPEDRFPENARDVIRIVLKSLTGSGPRLRNPKDEYIADTYNVSDGFAKAILKASKSFIDANVFSNEKDLSRKERSAREAERYLKGK